MHFKFKVVDLLEIYIRKQGTNPLLLELVLPLLDAIEITQQTLETGNKSVSGEYKNLLDRMRGVYKNKLCKPKEYAPERNPGCKFTLRCQTSSRWH